MKIRRIPPHKEIQPPRMFMLRRIFGRQRWGITLMREGVWIIRKEIITNKIWRQWMSNRHLRSLKR